MQHWCKLTKEQRSHLRACFNLYDSGYTHAAIMAFRQNLWACCVCVKCVQVFVRKSDSCCPIRIIITPETSLVISQVASPAGLFCDYQQDKNRKTLYGHIGGREKEVGSFLLFQPEFLWTIVLFISQRAAHSLPNKAASFSTARHYWPVDIQCISPFSADRLQVPAWVMCPQEGFLCPVRHWVTREDRDTWTGRWLGSKAFPWGCIPLSSWSSLSARTTAREREKEREECEVWTKGTVKRESSDRELDRVIILFASNNRPALSLYHKYNQALTHCRHRLTWSNSSSQLS